MEHMELETLHNVRLSHVLRASHECRRFVDQFDAGKPAGLIVALGDMIAHKTDSLITKLAVIANMARDLKDLSPEDFVGEEEALNSLVTAAEEVRSTWLGPQELWGSAMQLSGKFTPE
jgi:hypothetical protein